MSDARATEPWHLDKRVPIALILTVVIQTAGLVWWAAALSGKVSEHDRRIVQMEAQDLVSGASVASIKADVAVLVERQAATIRTLDRVERLLDNRQQGSR